MEGHLHLYLGSISSKMLFLNFIDIDLRVRNSFRGQNWADSTFQTNFETENTVFYKETQSFIISYIR